MNYSKSSFYEVLSNKFNIDIDEISSEKSFSDLGANSLDMVELIIELENTLNIIIKDEVADNFKTVGDIEQFLFYKLKNDYSI